MRGRFITFEGGEGTGKSTHAALLAARLRAFGIGVHLTREPGGSPGAEIMRYILLSGAARPLGPNAEAMLFAAARDDHLTTLIRPALDRGKWVVCDRFADSTRIYQGVAGKVDPRAIRAMERIIVGDTKPDLTFILDVPAKEGMQRAAKRRGKGDADRFEAETLAFHEKLRDGFLTLAANEPDRCVLIDATMPKEEVAEQIWRVVPSGSIPPPRRSSSRTRRPEHGRTNRAMPPTAAAAPDGGAVRPCRGRAGAARRLSLGPDSARLADRRRRAASARRRWPTAWRASCWRIPTRRRRPCRTPRSLAVPADHPVARRIAGQAHSDLLVLQRVVNEKTGKLFTEIRVDDVRRSVAFFGSTAGEGGWRVAIVDPIDELNRNGENALLKVLEEPPPRALLLLVSHAPGRVLPTIRSRCRTLMLRPLAADDVARAVAAAQGEAEPTAEIRAAAEAADGSVGRALTLLEGDALELRRQVIGLLERLPQLDPRALHALGDEIAGTEAETLAAFMDAVNGWLSARLQGGAADGQRLARVAEVWHSVNHAAREAEAYNLDRKPFVFSVFGQLAEAARP